jgi:2-amino-4-hydroxy-6-hydroxymethyldihydropteridine diphosphokinase
MGTTAFIALGSNVRHVAYGAPRAVLAAAMRQIADLPKVELQQVSDAFRSLPVGPPQPLYVNAVCRIETSLSPEALLAALQNIEAQFGRKRARRWSARVLDLDLICFGDIQSRHPKLMVPHPQMHLRSFVLRPMLQVGASWRHPVLNRSVAQLWHGLRRRSDVFKLGPV